MASISLKYGFIQQTPAVQTESLDSQTWTVFNPNVSILGMRKHELCWKLQ